MVNIVLGPQGQTLAAGSKFEEVQLWDANTCQPLHTLAGGAEEGTIVFSPDGRMIATRARGDDTLSLWDANTGQLLHEFWDPRGFRIAAFSPDNRRLALASNDGIWLWDIDERTFLYLLPTRGALVIDLAFTADGRTLISGDPDVDGKVRLWHLVEPSRQSD
jgi:WD40 repeat protein